MMNSVRSHDAPSPTWLFVLAAFLSTASCAVEPPNPGSFYQWEGSLLSQAPGDILRVEAYDGAPRGANAWRVLYRSTGLAGEPIAVSGVVFAPDKPASAKNRSIVAWAHPTTGVASRCAPSLRNDLTMHVPGLQQFLDHGFVVAATDYPGLGTGAPHPYLVGESEGRAILDSVRAASRLAESGAGEEFVVWGHSQGGHAALFAGQVAGTYAPDLKIAGVAAAAPATDLATLLRDDLQSKAGKILTAFARWSWNRVYDAPLTHLLDASATIGMNGIATECIEDRLEGLAVARREKAIDQTFLGGDLTEIEPWKSLLGRNTPGRTAAGAPLYIAQGSADEIVRPQVSVGYAEAACGKGTPVRFDWRDGISHKDIATDSAAAAVEWIAARLKGTPPETNCADLPQYRKIAAGLQ
jgi:alpha-beta hydrolase superfamily lysophospholipase